jgi:hypothetical protein
LPPVTSFDYSQPPNHHKQATNVTLLPHSTAIWLTEKSASAALVSVYRRSRRRTKPIGGNVGVIVPDLRAQKNCAKICE